MGEVGSSPEIYEKISSRQGMVVIFSPRKGKYTYITQHSVGQILWKSPGLEASYIQQDRVIIDVVFNHPGAKIIFFTSEIIHS